MRASPSNRPGIERTSRNFGKTAKLGVYSVWGMGYCPARSRSPWTPPGWRRSPSGLFRRMPGMEAGPTMSGSEHIAVDLSFMRWSSSARPCRRSRTQVSVPGNAHAHISRLGIVAGGLGSTRRGISSVCQGSGTVAGEGRASWMALFPRPGSAGTALVGRRTAVTRF